MARRLVQRADLSPEKLTAAREYGKLYARKWRGDNREHNKRYAKAYRQKCNAKHNQFIQAAKTACLICGETDKRVLQFHHRDPKTKSFPIANYVGRQWSMDVLRREVAKCDVLCANCHLKIEWQIRQEKIVGIS